LGRQNQRKGFVMGNHQFCEPADPTPDLGLDGSPKHILGAPPPTFLDGLVRESTKDSASAKELLTGAFCGHGEPTITVFDLIIDGTEELHIDGIFADTLSQEDTDGDEDDDEGAAGAVSLLAVRKPGGTWHVIFRRDWAAGQETLVGVQAETLTAAEAAKLSGQPLVGRLSIGFEYPCDADSRDAVTWMTIDILEKGKRETASVLDVELA
jgi:hypothetical protein